MTRTASAMRASKGAITGSRSDTTTRSKIRFSRHVRERTAARRSWTTGMPQRLSTFLAWGAAPSSKNRGTTWTLVSARSQARSTLTMSGSRREPKAMMTVWILESRSTRSSS